MPYELPAESAYNINNLLPNVHWYKGYDPNTGQIKLVNQGMGYYFTNRTSNNLYPCGPSVTLAMALTERCMALGRGKVFYVAKPYRPTTASRPIASSSSGNTVYHSDSYLNLPEIFWTDFAWDDANRKRWREMAQSSRLRLLSARNNALASGLPLLPIRVCYELESGSNVTLRIAERLSLAVIYVNGSGFIYTGFTDDMAPQLTWHGVSATRIKDLGFYRASQASLAQFQATSGNDLAQRLLAMYLQPRHPENLMLYGALQSKILQAHKDWVANGGATYEGDRSLGAKLGDKVEKMRLKQQEIIEADKLKRALLPGSREHRLAQESGDMDVERDENEYDDDVIEAAAREEIGAPSSSAFGRDDEQGDEQPLAQRDQELDPPSDHHPGSGLDTSPGAEIVPPLHQLRLEDDEQPTIAVQTGLDFSPMLRQLNAAFQAWPDYLKPARTAYNASRTQGIGFERRYVAWDPIWNQLMGPQRQLLYDIADAEDMAAQQSTRAAADAGRHHAGPAHQDDDDEEMLFQ